LKLHLDLVKIINNFVKIKIFIIVNLMGVNLNIYILLICFLLINIVGIGNIRILIFVADGYVLLLFILFLFLLCICYDLLDFFYVAIQQVYVGQFNLLKVSFKVQKCIILYIKPYHWTINVCNS
jgi:hypothetical protein